MLLAANVATPRKFHFVLIVVARVDKNGTAFCHKDLV